MVSILGYNKYNLVSCLSFPHSANRKNKVLDEMNLSAGVTNRSQVTGTLKTTKRFRRHCLFEKGKCRDVCPSSFDIVFRKPMFSVFYNSVRSL